MTKHFVMLHASQRLTAVPYGLILSGVEYRVDVRAFVQARMSSQRLPGKVLAPFRGRPLIEYVLEGAAEAVGFGNVVLLTSTEGTDDPLANHAAALGVPVFRGDLENVLGRFQTCLAFYPCEWFVRLCADSPLLDPALISRAVEAARGELDLVTNVFPRSYPRGRSVEVVRAEAFAELQPSDLTQDEQEHVTLYFYKHPERFRIENLSSGQPELAETNLCVDTLDDLRRLEALE